MNKCPLCEDEEDLKQLFEASNAFVSVAEIQKFPYKKSDNYCKGDLDIEIVQCNKCGYIYNTKFDNNKMQKAYCSGEYITPITLSKTMNSYVKFLRDKIKQYAKKDSIFLEIAPGGCDLLFALSKDSKFIYSVDPSVTPSTLLKDVQNIQHIKGCFSYDVINQKLSHKIDFIISRHLIEHIDTPRKFLEDIVKIIANNGIIYLETPNILNIFESKRFYEIRHEHCGYYQNATLINIMKEFGCELLECLSLYEGQWLGWFFKKNSNFCQSKEDFKVFDETINIELINEKNKLEQLLLNYQKIAIYGGGSHANSLISYLSTNICKKIVCAIDKDKRRHGTYLQNSDILILEPSIENLKNIDCIVMAMPIYEKIVFEKEILKISTEGKIELDIIFTSNIIQTKSQCFKG
ncbi:class I SAM-dependent methyltransferase [Campylobacter jejuni]|uniref:class I SAM-dependent methyltransferase n=1 Tax=Campylobacter jejuni TaxID=197 RepID=UPI000F7FB30D|nr:class I SAM-dependent methyltransferase [Campylobacter jejuni]RTJ54516.1 SAM-dependent methyltransferase [Campylobacter jejuni]